MSKYFYTLLATSFILPCRIAESLVHVGPIASCYCRTFVCHTSTIVLRSGDCTFEYSELTCMINSWCFEIILLQNIMQRILKINDPVSKLLRGQRRVAWVFQANEGNSSLNKHKLQTRYAEEHLQQQKTTQETEVIIYTGSWKLKNRIWEKWCLGWWWSISAYTT